MQNFMSFLFFGTGGPIENFDQGRSGEGGDLIYSGSIQLLL